MHPSDEYSAPGGPPPLLAATFYLDEALLVLRRDLLRPFDTPPRGADCFEIWHAHEEKSRPGCEQAIQHWLQHRQLPDMDDAVAFFLCRRFDQVSDFAQNLFLDDQTTVFSHPGHSLDDVLRWLLVNWWEAHGRRMAFSDDLDWMES